LVGTQPKEGAFIPIGLLAENNKKGYLNILRGKWNEIKSR